MKKMILVLVTVFILVILASCQSTGPGPTVWIDQPLNGSKHSVKDVIIQTHASDKDGVEEIQFFIADEQIWVQKASGEQLAEAKYVWLPTSPGKYMIGVKAIDAKGDVSGLTKIQIEIMDGIIDEIQAEASLTPQIFCEVSELKAPELLLPDDGAQIKGTPNLEWSYPEGECEPQAFVIDISPDSSFSDVSLGFGTMDLKETSRQLPLETGKCYFWRVHVITPGGVGPNSTIRSFCVNQPVLPTEQTTTITLTDNANCRTAPGKDYPVMGSAIKGNSYEMIGRKSNNAWFKIIIGSIPSGCWVASSTGSVSGDLDQVEIIEDIPLITPSVSPFIITTAIVDTQPPEISEITISPPVVSAVSPIPCPGATAITVTVIASDAISSIRVYAENPETGEYKEMNDIGNHQFQTTLSPGNLPGQKSILIHAYDGNGNYARGDWATFTVIPCLQ